MSPYNQDRFKTHSSFLPIGQASFITPYRNHRGDNRLTTLRRALAVAAVIPIRS
jgi:hypothetical protein